MKPPMRTVYHFPDTDFVTTSTGESLVSNGFGDFFCIAPDFSYQGWYHFRNTPWRLEKSIAALTPLDEGEQTSFYHHLYGMKREWSSGAQDMIIPYQHTLLYSTRQFTGRVLLTLDHRGAYEGSQLGRNYRIIEKEGLLLIHFQGKNEHWLCIKGAKQHEVLSNWKEVQYPRDAKRGARANYWVYDALTFTPGAFVSIGEGSTEAKATTRSTLASYHFQDILSNVQEHTNYQLFELPIHDATARSATRLASWSLNQVLQRFSHEHVLVEGIYAGLPWFFQLWSRDELISLGGLLVQFTQRPELKTTYKEILQRYMDQMKILHELPNRFPPSELGSVDAFGWWAVRFLQFFEALSAEELLDYFSIEELNTWYETLYTSLEHAKDTRGTTVGGAVLFTNKVKETWMDTTYGDDGRPGLRIEIQALYASVYRALVTLADYLPAKDGSQLQRERQNYIAAVRSVFVQEGIILDGRGDATPRPNVFLAAYVAPELFNKTTWHATIEHLLKELWLPWGGLSTLPKTHALFQANYTGEEDKSYHRGDSWYFVNNIAGIILERYGFGEAKQVLQASAKDIHEFGFAGHASELSSASIPSGEASPVQAWSMATFLELAHELYRDA